MLVYGGMYILIYVYCETCKSSSSGSTSRNKVYDMFVVVMVAAVYVPRKIITKIALLSKRCHQCNKSIFFMGI